MRFGRAFPEGRAMDPGAEVALLDDTDEVATNIKDGLTSAALCPL
jgi:hypothetical protein